MLILAWGLRYSLKKGVKQESVDFEVGVDTHCSTLVSGVEENFMQNACILIAFIDEKKESSRDFKMQFYRAPLTSVMIP